MEAKITSSMMLIIRVSVGVNIRPGGSPSMPRPNPPKKLSSEAKTTLGSMTTIDVPRSPDKRTVFTDSGACRSCRYSENGSVLTRSAVMRGLVRNTSSNPNRRWRVNRSVIISTAAKLIPMVVSSVTKLWGRISALRAASGSIREAESSSNPSSEAKALSSSSESLLLSSAITLISPIYRAH